MSSFGIYFGGGAIDVEVGLNIKKKQSMILVRCLLLRWIKTGESGFRGKISSALDLLSLRCLLNIYTWR